MGEITSSPALNIARCSSWFLFSGQWNYLTSTVLWAFLFASLNNLWVLIPNFVLLSYATSGAVWWSRLGSELKTNLFPSFFVCFTTLPQKNICTLRKIWTRKIAPSIGTVCKLPLSLEETFVTPGHKGQSQRICPTQKGNHSSGILVTRQK